MGKFLTTLALLSAFLAGCAQSPTVPAPVVVVHNGQQWRYGWDSDCNLVGPDYYGSTEAEDTPLPLKVDCGVIESVPRDIPISPPKVPGQVMEFAEEVADEFEDRYGDLARGEPLESSPPLISQGDLDCPITGREPAGGYDPFDSCSVAQWTVYAVMDENLDAWFALGYPYYYDELRFDEGILLDEGQATAELNEFALYAEYEIHQFGVPSAWECAVWVDYGDPEPGIVVIFKGESWEGVPIFLWVIYSKDSQDFEWELEEWAEKWRQAWIFDEYEFISEDTHDFAEYEQVIEVIRQEYGGQPCGP